MSYNNTYTHGQIWAQALAAGREIGRSLEPLLTTTRFGRQVAAFNAVDSTNTVATAWAAQGGPEGAIVLAEHQLEGRGRLGRAWLDAAGKNLTFSVLIRPRLRPEGMGLIMLAASVAVADALTGIDEAMDVHIKWPNDVLLGGRKCCGMLMETSSLGARTDRDAGAVVGIGLNVNQDEFPEEFASRATSLALETGRLFRRPPILASILNRFELHYESLGVDGGEAVRASYLSRMVGLKESVEVYPPAGGTPIAGRVRGISPVGALLLETPGGIRTLASGDVTFRRAS